LLNAITTIPGRVKTPVVIDDTNLGGSDEREQTCGKACEITPDHLSQETILTHVLSGAREKVDAARVMKFRLEEWMTECEPRYGRIEWRYEVICILFRHDRGARDKVDDVRTVS